MDRAVSVLVASIPHTGTFFVLDSILRDFTWQMFEREPIPGCKQHRHLFQPGDDALMKERMHQCVTVVPVREYDAVKRTWLRNGMNIEKLAIQWEKMLFLKDVFFLQIDASNKNEQLKKLSKIVGCELSTNWQPLNTMNFGKV